LARTGCPTALGAAAALFSARSDILTKRHQEWAMDFVADGIASGRGIRILTMVDWFTRECPAIEVEVSLGSQSRY
jgi:hypothetical protein